MMMDEKKVAGMVERNISFKMRILVLALVVLGGCGIKLIPSHDQWYMQHYIIMQDHERDVYKNLSDGGKVEFQGLFWEARRPESKAEFDMRMDYVIKQFKRENSAHPWNTDRGRIYLLNGSPASIDFKQTDDWGISITNQPTQAGVASDRSNENIQARTAEGWTYQYQKMRIYYIFTYSPPKAWELIQTSFEGNRYLGEFEMESRELFFGVIDIESYNKALERLKSIK